LHAIQLRIGRELSLLRLLAHDRRLASSRMPATIRTGPARREAARLKLAVIDRSGKAV